jgi:hypothetical protein
MKQIHSALILGALAIASAPALATPLSRANIVLSSATAVDPATNTVPLPLHQGRAKGGTVWYVITDESDATAAAKLGTRTTIHSHDDKETDMTRLALIDPNAPGEAPCGSVFGLRDMVALPRSPQDAIAVFNDAYTL